MNRDYSPVDPAGLPDVGQGHRYFVDTEFANEASPDLSRDAEHTDDIPLMASPGHQMLSPEPSIDSYMTAKRQRVSTTGTL